MLTDREFHWLKRRVFCTYCAKILVDPHTLTCLHSVCAGCVSKIRTLSGAAGVAYQCTVCDRFYDKIKPNFIIARLVSAFQEGRSVDVDSVEVLQGHPGAVYARVKNSGLIAEVKPQSTGHGTWDRKLEEEITTRLGDGSTTFREMKEMGRGIVSHFDTTIWKGTTNPAGPIFDIYFDGSGAPRTFSQLKSNLGDEDVARLTDKIEQITGSL